MYCVIKCVKTKCVLKGNFASSVFHSCNTKTQKTQICVTGPQCVNTNDNFMDFFVCAYVCILLVGQRRLYNVQNLLPWNSSAVSINNITKVVLMVRITNYYHRILLGWSDWEDGMSLGRGTSGKQIILQWSNLVFLQIYSMTVRLSAMFEEHMKTVFSNWKCVQRHSVLKKLCAARRKRKPTSKTYSFRRDSAGSQPGAAPNQAGLYLTANINCVAISFSWVLTCCEFWGFHSAIMSDSLFLGCPLLSLLIDLKPIKMKATYRTFPSITRMLSIQKHSVNGKKWWCALCN
jgi:hypothetical protein